MVGDNGRATRRTLDERLNDAWEWIAEVPADARDQLWRLVIADGMLARLAAWSSGGVMYDGKGRAFRFPQTSGEGRIIE